MGVLVTIAALGASADAVVSNTAQAPLKLRAVTFNLLHGGIFSELTGDDQALAVRLQMVVDELRMLDADVIGLQEASTGAHRKAVAGRLASALGYRYVYAPAATRPFGSESGRRLVAAVLRFTEGPAILSRFPIVRWRAYELPRCGHPFDVRVLLFAELLTPAGRLPTFSAHISGTPCQARAVGEIVRSHRGSLPAVIMGDFNAAEGSSAIRILTHHAGFIDTFRLANPQAAGFTEGQQVGVRRATATRRIDYVFLAPDAEAPGWVASSRVVLDHPQPGSRVLWPSDHYGVLTEIGIRRGGTRLLAGTAGSEARAAGAPSVAAAPPFEHREISTARRVRSAMADSGGGRGVEAP